MNDFLAFDALTLQTGKCDFFNTQIQYSDPHLIYYSTDTNDDDIRQAILYLEIILYVFICSSAERYCCVSVDQLFTMFYTAVSVTEVCLCAASLLFLSWKAVFKIFCTLVLNFIFPN